jgi:response regulator of citrate/malate metabolism
MDLVIKVLIVEDDPMLAFIHKKFIENIEFFSVVNVIHNGKEAYNYIKDEEIDLLILDVYLPGLNGFEILKKIRSKGILTDVILVTAANSAEDLKKARSYGAFDYMVKPFEYDRLKLALQKYLSIKKEFINKSLMSQDDLDAFFNAEKNENIELPKGLHKKTLQRVIKILKATDKKSIDVSFVAEEIDISKVTARRYLDYLGKIGEIEIEMSHGSRGRPAYIYKIKY